MMPCDALLFIAADATADEIIAASACFSLFHALFIDAILFICHAASSDFDALLRQQAR